MALAEKRKPWMKWYPRDWRAETGLQLVSRAARSVWLDMLGLMHESTLIGYLLLNGKKPTPEQLARVLGDDIRDLSRWLDELASAGIYSENEDGIIYSRRMVRDHEMAERGREEVKKRKGAWSKDDEKSDRSPTSPPNRVPGSLPITQRPEARGHIISPVGPGTPGPTAGGGNPYTEDFEQFWKAYPRNSNMTKFLAFEVWEKLKAAGALPDLPQMLVAVAGYRKFLADQSKGRVTPYRVQHADKWLKERKYEGQLEAPAVAVGVSTAGWEASHPDTWGKLREQLREMHGSDSLWLQLFGRCQLQPGSPFTVICTDEFERDRLNDRFAAKLTAMFDVPVTFTVRRPFQSSPPSPTPTQELRH